LLRLALLRGEVNELDLAHVEEAQLREFLEKIRGLLDEARTDKEKGLKFLKMKKQKCTYTLCFS
jgi:hypothetical protein